MKQSNWIEIGVGDFIVTPTGDKARVMAVMDEVFVRSSWQRFDVAQEIVGIKDAQKKGWLLMKKGKLPITQEELEALLGCEVEFIGKKKHEKNRIVGFD